MPYVLEKPEPPKEQATSGLLDCVPPTDVIYGLLVGLWVGGEKI